MSGAALSELGPGNLALVGELDFDSVASLLEQGLAKLNSADALVLDLSGVTRANSAGLALLLEWLEQGRRRGVDLRFANLPASLVDIARISNATDLLPVEPGSGD